jgi:hypothetical protein
VAPIVVVRGCSRGEGRSTGAGAHKVNVRRGGPTPTHRTPPTPPCRTPPHPAPQVAPVLGGFNKDDYVSERLWARSSDGTMVPISLVYRKDMYKRDGNANLLLYG